jgi:hypothetical protein
MSDRSDPKALIGDLVDLEGAYARATAAAQEAQRALNEAERKLRYHRETIDRALRAGLIAKVALAQWEAGERCGSCPTNETSSTTGPND